MTSFNNKIQIARGSLETKGTLAYGELFYDKGSSNLFIGKKIGDGSEVTPSRVGGADGLVLKGVINNGVIPAPGGKYNLIAGDAYFLSKPIYFKRGAGGVCESVITPADFPLNPDYITWEKDSIIIYLGSDTGAANSEVVFSNWLYVNSAFMKADHVKFDTTGLEWLKEGTFAEFATIEDIQTALQYLFKTNFAYNGTLGKANEVFEGPLNIVEGTFVHFVGEASHVGEIDLPENSLVFKQNGIITAIPLGASDPNSIGFTFNQAADYVKSNETIASKDGTGKSNILTQESDIKSVTNALDWLNGTKADLDANNKIPLAQIPSTLIGALQFKGTIDIDTLIGKEGLDKSDITGAEFKNYLSTHLPGSVTEKVPLDEGDYVIFSKKSLEDATVKIDSVAYNAGDWAIYLPSSPDTETTQADRFERINASAAVDNVNGVTGSVQINASDEFKVITSGQNITISNNTLLDDQNNVPQNHIPILSAADHVVVDSNVSVGISATSGAVTLTDTNQAPTVTLEFPKESGVIATAKEGFKGEPHRLAKFDEKGQIDNANVEDKDGTLKIGVNPTASSLEVQTAVDSLTLKAVIPGDTGNSTNHFKLDMSTQDNHGGTADHAKPATILTDVSVIDCGEW